MGMEALIGVLGAGVGAGLMSLIQTILKRKWAEEDKQEEKLDKLDKLEKRLDEIDKKLEVMSDDLGHVKNADRAILSDRIKWLGEKYLEDEEIGFEDRRVLNQLHDAYHNDCGGNGDYKKLMESVNELPLKIK